MNFLSLEKFVNYKPIFNDDPKDIIEDIIKKWKEYLPADTDYNEIWKAYEFARKAHQHSLPRHSGEPYIVHPVLSTVFLMKIKPWIKSIQACLLHDVIEDTPYTYDDVKEHFGLEVADLCSGLEKVSKVKYKIEHNLWERELKNKLIEAGETRNIETLKKTFLAMGKDLRVIFIKLADRIHNVQTLTFHPKEEKKQRIAEETLKIFVPIAQRLWLSVFQTYLENGSFRALNEKDFNKIFNYVKKRYWQDQSYTNKWVEMLESILKSEKTLKSFDIKWRLKSPYRIYKKMKKYQTTDISKIMDVMAFRIVTETIPDCYNILWIIHSYYTPIINKIKDYISLPKQNWYRSIHTTVLGMFEFPVEIQIRTRDMDEIAQFWIAAHFAYKEEWWSVEVSEKQAQWIKKLQEIVKEFQEESDKERFKDELQIEILDKNIFIYTPSWEVKELPHWSTVLDFAFRIHTDLWLKFKTAFVNNVIVPIDFKLNNWDIVNIVSYKNRFTFSKSWLNFLHTPSAKGKLNKYLKGLEKDEYIKDWLETINAKLKHFSLPLIESKNDLIWKKYKWEELEKILIMIHEKQLTPLKLIKRFYPDKILDKLEQQIKPVYIDTEEKPFILIDWDKQLSHTLCPECKPKANDIIIWRSSKEWIKIHKISCSALKSISFEKLVEVHWNTQSGSKYNISFELDMLDKPGVLLKILTIFSNFNINISNINVWNNPVNWYSKIFLNIDVANPSKIHFVLKELKNQENLVKIISKKFI